MSSDALFFLTLAIGATGIVLIILNEINRRR